MALQEIVGPAKEVSWLGRGGLDWGGEGSWLAGGGSWLGRGAVARGALWLEGCPG